MKQKILFSHLSSTKPLGRYPICNATTYLKDEKSDIYNCDKKKQKNNVILFNYVKVLHVQAEKVLGLSTLLPPPPTITNHFGRSIIQPFVWCIIHEKKHFFHSLSLQIIHLMKAGEWIGYNSATSRILNKDFNIFNNIWNINDICFIRKIYI